MSAQSICVSYLREILSGVHGPADTYKLALFTEKADLDHETEVYDPANEVSGTGYDAGGKDLSLFAVASSEKTAFITFDSPVLWPASTITARYGLLYNATQGDKAVAVIDFLVIRTSTNGNFKVDLPSQLIRITGP